MKKYIISNSNKWNNDWRYKIPSEVRDRLNECHNTWDDVKIMGKAIKEANPDRDAEDCAVKILDWMDSNGQWRFGCESTPEQYQELLDYINTAIDFTEVYNNAYDLYAETQDYQAVMKYLVPLIGLPDAMQMAGDIKETYNL